MRALTLPCARPRPLGVGEDPAPWEGCGARDQSIAPRSLDGALARCGGGFAPARPPPSGAVPSEDPLMSASLVPPISSQSPLHVRILAVLPRIELHSRVYFRHKCPDR